MQEAQQDVLVKVVFESWLTCSRLVKSRRGGTASVNRSNRAVQAEAIMSTARQQTDLYMQAGSSSSSSEAREAACQPRRSSRHQRLLTSDDGGRCRVRGRRGQASLGWVAAG